MNTNLQIPPAINEPIKAYEPNSLDRKNLLACYKKQFNDFVEIPQYIGKEVVFSGNIYPIYPPQNHSHAIGCYHYGDDLDIKKAIKSALEAKPKWEATSPSQRATIFLKVAALAAGPYRNLLNASTMLGQSKNMHQAEIDAACELVDFFRFNVEFMANIYKEQPQSTLEEYNILDYRPLEGFVLAITPFNFTAISANLPAAPALMGNTVVWKPSIAQLYSAQVIMTIFKEAGLPDGVINMIITDPIKTAQLALEHRDFAGIHFTGSTKVFQDMWQMIGSKINHYRSYPRIVGETGGKDFIWAHPTANNEALITAIIRGAFEYQGQKCSAASRAYISQSTWKSIEKSLKEQVNAINVGSPENPANFVNAVINRQSYDKIISYLKQAQQDPCITLIAGGTYDDTVGYFIHPTVLKTTDPFYRTMVEEIFGPVITIYVYEDEDWEKSLDLVNETSAYALTGAIFTQDIYVQNKATKILRQAAGNLYINDKPTGAVVGRQPFGGSRASGTNDKAGSPLNLLRWVSPRLIKETLVPPINYTYPYLQTD